ncbi:MAG: fumarylacetoacetate hydrolase family protein, partial [Ketobacteraceae bacterium]|nr:fumarylacetoacetate hydrolase family protein [Ketobacteraceae bacterium]
MMSLNVLRFEHQGNTQWGVIHDNSITPIPGEFATSAEFLTHNSLSELAELKGDTIEHGDVRVLSPVTRNQQFICQGANYRQHMIESGMDPDAKSFNMIFRKASSCMVGADSKLERPAHVKLLDYEIELGLVLKNDVTGPVTVNEANLHEYVAGIVIVNDYSARDVQIPQMQFYKGKSYRTFGPVGPYLCLLEPADIHYLKELDLCLT